MIDYRFNGRLTYIPGGALSVNMSAWPAASGFDKTGLISWWSLDETSGTRADSHGTNDLTDVNTVGYASGKISNAGDFEADNNESLYIASNSDVTTGNIDFTFCGWAYFESLGGAGTGRVIAGKYDTNATIKREWLLYRERVGGTGFLTFAVSSSGTAITDTIQVVDPSLSTWYFYVCWHDSVNNTINLQINNGTPISKSYSAGVATSSARFALGALLSNNSPYAPYAMDGLIDEASFWKRVLTSDERTWLYNSGNGRGYSEL
jgi:hypothetical protein